MGVPDTHDSPGAQSHRGAPTPAGTSRLGRVSRAGYRSRGNGRAHGIRSRTCGLEDPVQKTSCDWAYVGWLAIRHSSRCHPKANIVRGRKAIIPTRTTILVTVRSCGHEAVQVLAGV